MKSPISYPLYWPKSGTPETFAYFFRSAWNCLVAGSFNSTGFPGAEKMALEGTVAAAGESRKSCP